MRYDGTDSCATVVPIRRYCHQAYVDIVSNAAKFHGICKIGNEVKTIQTLPYYKLIQEDKRFISPYKIEK